MLTVRKVETAPPGKYADGGRSCLWLLVSPGGARRWFVRVTVDNKRREMSLGSYPAVSLATAREAAWSAKSSAASGVDPVSARRQKERSAAGMPTFTMCAARYIRAHRRSWQNAKHSRQWVATLKLYARPILGAMSVDTIGTDEVLRVLAPIWQVKTETAKRVQGRMENILDFAAAMQWRDPNNPARWRGHLDKLLAQPTKIRVARHHPAMPFSEVAGFMRELESVDGVAALALRFMILSATRTGETLNATWPEIDLEAAIWTIPAPRMKGRREHRVPLSDVAMTVLNTLPRIDGESWIFPGGRSGRPLSTMSLLMTMRRLGYGVNGTRGDYVPHGFRSSFRDWCGEVSTFPTNLAEAALAHVLGDKTEAAYARGDLFVKRRRLMAEWAGWCTRPAADVVDLAERAGVSA